MRHRGLFAGSLFVLLATPQVKTADCAIIDRGAIARAPNGVHAAIRVTELCSSLWVTVVVSNVLIVNTRDRRTRTVLSFDTGSGDPLRVSVRWDGNDRVIVSVPDAAGIGYRQSLINGIAVEIEVD